MTRNKKKKTGGKIAKGRRPASTNNSNLVTVQDIVNTVLQALIPRISELETSFANKVESDAASFRLLFDYAGISSDMRQSALHEMYIVRELLTLVCVISDQFELETPEDILMEMANISLRTDEHAIKKPITVVFVWAKPNTVFKDKDWPMTTLCAMPGEGIKFDPGAVTPNQKEGELAFVFVDKSAFMEVVKGQSSTELEFMEHMVGIDVPATVGNFIYALDLDDYFNKLRKKDVEESRHPEGAKKFGGKTIAEMNASWCH